MSDERTAKLPAPTPVATSKVIPSAVCVHCGSVIIHYNGGDWKRDDRPIGDAERFYCYAGGDVNRWLPHTPAAVVEPPVPPVATGNRIGRHGGDYPAGRFGHTEGLAMKNDVEAMGYCKIHNRLHKPTISCIMWEAKLPAPTPVATPEETCGWDELSDLLSTPVATPEEMCEICGSCEGDHNFLTGQHWHKFVPSRPPVATGEGMETPKYVAVPNPYPAHFMTSEMKYPPQPTAKAEGAALPPVPEDKNEWTDAHWTAYKRARKGMTFAYDADNVAHDKYDHQLVRLQLQIDAALSKVAELESKLEEMTIDRNLWKDAHNEDCPNLHKP